MNARVHKHPACSACSFREAETRPARKHKQNCPARLLSSSLEACRDVRSVIANKSHNRVRGPVRSVFQGVSRSRTAYPHHPRIHMHTLGTEAHALVCDRFAITIRVCLHYRDAGVLEKLCRCKQFTQMRGLKIRRDAKEEKRRRARTA